MSKSNCHDRTYTFTLTKEALDGVNLSDPMEVKANMIRMSSYCPGCPRLRQPSANPPCYPIASYVETADQNFVVEISPSQVK
ncbi:hypothetical protein HYV64_00975 [Candidatus Shapirobacteria bacterium]|nr:hypothetical protein [Candidatus Shapirobacteria bacterium]